MRHFRSWVNIFVLLAFFASLAPIALYVPPAHAEQAISQCPECASEQEQHKEQCCTDNCQCISQSCHNNQITGFFLMDDLPYSKRPMPILVAHDTVKADRQIRLERPPRA